MDIAIHHILLPTDLQRDGHVAFVHALKLALAVQGKITLLHAEGRDAEAEWGDFPAVRDTLHAWGLLPADARHRDVSTLGLAVRKVITDQGDPVSACLHHLEGHPADMLVLAPEQADSGSRVTAPLSRKAGLPTLFVPKGVPGFVDPATGTLALRRVLLPVSSTPSPQAAVEWLNGLLVKLGVTVDVTVFHVGDPANVPALDHPGGQVGGWQVRTSDGEVVPAIIAVAEGHDLVVMPTDGRSGLREMLQGSHTERVARAVPCPLLAVPV